MPYMYVMTALPPNPTSPVHVHVDHLDSKLNLEEVHVLGMFFLGMG